MTSASTPAVSSAAISDVTPSVFGRHSKVGGASASEVGRVALDDKVVGGSMSTLRLLVAG